MLTVTLTSGHSSLTRINNWNHRGDMGGEDISFFFVTNDDYGTKYSMTFECSEQPCVLAIQGHMVSQGWSYNLNNGENQYGAGVVSLTVSLANFGKGNHFKDVNGASNKHVLVITFMPLASTEEGSSLDEINGPPVEAMGMYFASSVLDWSMQPPESKSNPTFGFKLIGPDGHKGGLTFFFPKKLAKWLKTSYDKLVLYENGQQRVNVTKEVTRSGVKGVVFSIKTKFNAATAQKVIKSGSLISSLRADGKRKKKKTKKIMKNFAAGKRQAISIASSKLKVKKNTKITLYGWIAKGVKGRRVVIKKRIGKKGKFSSTGKSKAKKGSRYWSKKIKISKTSTYLVKLGKKKSKKIKIKVKKK